MNRPIWRSNSIAWSKRRGARSRSPEPGKRRFDSRSAAKNAAIRISGRVFRRWETRDKSGNPRSVWYRARKQAADLLDVRLLTRAVLYRRDWREQKRQRGAKKARTFLPSSPLFAFLLPHQCAMSNLI